MFTSGWADTTKLKEATLHVSFANRLCLKLKSCFLIQANDSDLRYMHYHSKYNKNKSGIYEYATKIAK
jgi:hypothetical protein